MSNFSVPTKNYRKSSGVLSILIFLLSPFFALVMALKNFRSSWAKNILWAFVVFYGYTFVINNEGMDSSRYRDRFLSLNTEEVTISNFTNYLYDEETQILDIVQPVTSFIVSRFTDNYHILFAVFGLIFGYFYSRNIWYLLERTGFKLEKLNILVIITFAVVVGFWEINGFRFWTAAHVFFYGALPLIWEGKKKYVWIGLLSVFVHFSFIFPVAILLLYMLLGNNAKLFFWIFIASFFIVEIKLEAVGNILQSVLPDILQSKVGDFTNIEYAENVMNKRGERSLHANLYNQALKFAVVGILIMIYTNLKKNLTKENVSIYNLFNFCLLFLAVANMASFIPAVGRFVRVGNLFAMALLFFYIQFVPHDGKIRRTAFAWIPMLLFYSIMAFRVGTETIGYLTIMGNPLVMSFIESDTALIEIIK